MDKNEQPIERIRGSRSVNFGLAICSIAIVLIGLVSWFYDYVSELAISLEF